MIVVTADSGVLLDTDFSFECGECSVSWDMELCEMFQAFRVKCTEICPCKVQKHGKYGTKERGAQGVALCDSCVRGEGFRRAVVVN
eukprot:93032-Amphidinium_carterae.1